jgi:hypothetical protein
MQTISEAISKRGFESPSLRHFNLYLFHPLSLYLVLNTQPLLADKIDGLGLSGGVLSRESPGHAALETGRRFFFHFPPTAPLALPHVWQGFPDPLFALLTP